MYDKISKGLFQYDQSQRTRRYRVSSFVSGHIGSRPLIYSINSFVSISHEIRHLSITLVQLSNCTCLSSRQDSENKLENGLVTLVLSRCVVEKPGCQMVRWGKPSVAAGQIEHMST